MKVAELLKLKKKRKSKNKVDDEEKLNREPLGGDGYMAAADSPLAQNDGNYDQF
jgi:hypothetical protein